MTIYMAVEFRTNAGSSGVSILEHNAICTMEELATDLARFRGYEHRITGYYTEGEMQYHTREERGLPSLKTG